MLVFTFVGIFLPYLSLLQKMWGESQAYVTAASLCLFALLSSGCIRSSSCTDLCTAFHATKVYALQAFASKHVLLMLAQNG
jgi:polyferredoxin